MEFSGGSDARGATQVRRFDPSWRREHNDVARRCPFRHARAAKTIREVSHHEWSKGEGDRGQTLTWLFRVYRKPTWGTCAGLILLAESANRTKKGGQELIGGIDVRVNRNHFGRQVESFQADLHLPFLEDASAVKEEAARPFRSVFIRAPVVERILPHAEGIQKDEAGREETIVAPSQKPSDEVAAREINSEVEVLARLPGNAVTLPEKDETASSRGEDGDIIAVKQGNVFGTSFHPELTGDARIHVWWIEQVLAAVQRRTQ